MRPISKVDEEDGSIRLYECDNEDCKYKTTETSNQ